MFCVWFCYHKPCWPCTWDNPSTHLRSAGIIAMARFNLYVINLNIHFQWFFLVFFCYNNWLTTLRDSKVITDLLTYWPFFIFFLYKSYIGQNAHLESKPFYEFFWQMHRLTFKLTRHHHHSWEFLHPVPNSFPHLGFSISFFSVKSDITLGAFLLSVCQASGYVDKIVLKKERGQSVENLLNGKKGS